MDKTTVSPQLFISKQLDKIIYDFFSIEIIKDIEGKRISNYTAKVHKEFIKEDENGYMFSVAILDKKESKTEEQDELEGLNEILDFLQEKIVLYTDSNGKIQSIINRTIIQEKWQDRIPKFRKNNRALIPNIEDIIIWISNIIADPIDFLQLIKKSGIFSLLFPPVFDIDLLKIASVSQQKELSNFFKHTSLPLELDTKVEALNVLTNGLQIIRNGKLDSYDFDKESVEYFFMDTYKIHKSNLSFGATILECYDLDSDNTIDKANGILSVEVPNVFSYRQINKLIKKN